MSLLLHVCCAPCSVACIQQLREEGLEPVAFWYNPNIHPFTEYRARRDTARAYLQSIGVRLIEMDQYGLRPFLSALPSWDDRCATCYALRFNAAAQYAAQNGLTPLPAPCSSAPIKTTPSCSRWLALPPRPKGSPSFTGISGPGSVPASSRPGRPAFTCKNTAAASSARRSAIPNGKNSLAPVDGIDAAFPPCPLRPGGGRRARPARTKTRGAERPRCLCRGPKAPGRQTPPPPARPERTNNAAHIASITKGIITNDSKVETAAPRAA